MTKSLYILKIGSSSIFSSDSIFDEIKEKIKADAKVLIIAGGNIAIECYYQNINRNIPYLQLINGDKVRHASHSEMPHIIASYENLLFPYLLQQFKKHDINAFTACAFRNELVCGERSKPLLTMNNGKKKIIHDHHIGKVLSIKTDVIMSLLGTFDVVCLSAPIASTNTSELALNIDADILAAELACSLDVNHVRFVTSTPGILKTNNDWDTSLSDVYIDDDLSFVTGKMKQKVKACQLVLQKSSADVCISGPHSFSSDSKKTWFWNHAKHSCEKLNWLTQAITINSVSKDEHEFSHFFKKKLNESNIDAYVDAAGNLVASKGTGSKTLLLLGHIDTVPATWPVKWENDTLTGRGSVDAKSSLINFLILLKSFDVPDWGKLIVVGATEEEISSSKGAFHIRDNLKDVDAVIIGEPSGSDKLTLGYHGLLKLEISTKVSLGHSAGKDYISSNDLFYQTISQLREDIFKHDCHTVSSLIEIHSSQDKKCHYTTGVICFRVSPHANLENLLKTVNTYQSTCQIITLRATPGVSYKQTACIARAFSRAFHQNNIKNRYVVKKGSSDMNTLATTWKDIPMVAYGPGDSSLDHTDHEVISGAEFQLAQTILTDAVTHWFALKK